MLANIPATQTVIEIKSPGGPRVLVPGTRPVPEPKAGEVLIRIASAPGSTAPIPCSVWDLSGRCRALVTFSASNAPAQSSNSAKG